MHDDPALRNLPPRAEAIAARHEVEDIELGGIKGFIVFLSLLLGVTLVVVWLVIRVLLTQTYASDANVSPFAGANHPAIPEPNLQPSRNHNTLDWQDMAALKSDEARKLGEYAWIGEDKHAARIPIDTAMDMIATQGLPTRDDGVAAGAPTAHTAELPVSGGAGGLMIAPSNPLTLPPGNQNPGNHE
jgi:hypothetical protein